MKAKKMAYRRKLTDPVLAAVIAEINMSAVKPDPGFMKMDDWAERWQMTNSQASIYIKRAVASGILVVRRYRVITNGRLRVLDHYGMITPKQKHCPKTKRRQ